MGSGVKAWSITWLRGADTEDAADVFCNAAEQPEPAQELGMSDRSKIEWTDATWSPVTGCTKVSAGCANCYAERDFHRPYPGRKFSDVRCHPERLEVPLHWRRPRRIFVCSIGDLFHEKVPDDFIRRVFATMALCDHHVFQLLTKRPKRALAFYRTLSHGWDFRKWVEHLMVNMELPPNGRSYARFPRTWPLPNVWLGVSCENQEAADERIPLLLQIPAAVRFVSLEPLLGPVDLTQIPNPGFGEGQRYYDALKGTAWCVSQDGGYYDVCSCSQMLDWVICGGESGPKARPMHPDWARSVVRQCRAASVPVFVKQIQVDGQLSRNPLDWPEDLRVRDFPEVRTAS